MHWSRKLNSYTGDNISFTYNFIVIILIATLICCILIAKKVNKKNIYELDILVSMLGIFLGSFITYLNLLYTNEYLITIGPLMIFACIIYIRMHDKLLVENTKIERQISNEFLKMIKIVYWSSISIAIISYHQAIPYNRPLLFFIAIAFGVLSIGLEILETTTHNRNQVVTILSKIFILSALLRASAFFISPYPIGSDPWGHADLINEMVKLGSVKVPNTFTSEYYTNYPLMHLLTAVFSILGNITLKESIALIGMILVLSTIFIYLLTKNITNSETYALFSVLLLNFADFHIKWSIEIIAMTFGIAMYTFLLYLITIEKKESIFLYNLFSILCIYIIIWTHTVSSFIALISVVSFLIGIKFYQYIDKVKTNYSIVGYSFIMLFMVILLAHWMDPKYPILESITRGLVISMSSEMGFLNRYDVFSNNSQSTINSIIEVFGFITYIFYGIIGSLFSINKKNMNQNIFSLIFTLIILYFIFFIFPIMGLRNILPYRWPAFIYVSFVIFTGIGVINTKCLIKNKNIQIIFISSFLLITSFFMITNLSTNMDSPIYNENAVQDLVWKESEMSLYEHINNSYAGTILTDRHSLSTVLTEYLKTDENKSGVYLLTPEKQPVNSYMSDKIIIWRKNNLERPILCAVVGFEGTHEIVLGKSFQKIMDENYNLICNTGEAKAYLGKNFSINNSNMIPY
jgi:hypothetical protein